MYATCVELLSLPLAPSIVANNIIDVVYRGYAIIPSDNLPQYINAIGIVLAHLPETYWSVIYDRLQALLQSPRMLTWNHRLNAFQMFNYKMMHVSKFDRTYSSLLAIMHAVFHHMGCFKLATLPR